MNKVDQDIISRVSAMVKFAKAKEVLPNLIPYSMFMTLDLRSREIYLKGLQPEIDKYEAFEQNMAAVADVGNIPEDLGDITSMRESLRLENRLAIGRLCWYNGKPYRILASTTECWALGNPEIEKIYRGASTTLDLVDKHSVEVLADEAFLIGDEVSSKWSNGFKGYVTGYEPEDNRVICVRKNNTSGPRIRFAYKPHELINQTWKVAHKKK